MKQNEKLHQIFGRFAGKEVKRTDENDPVLIEMKDAATANGLVLRIWWPDTVGTRDYRLDRVNAHIEKAKDGKWRISNDFTLG